MHKYSPLPLAISAILSMLTLLSCNHNKVSENKKSSSAPVPVMTKLPSFISDENEAHIYLSRHFWDNTNINDTLYLQNPILLKDFFIKYLRHLSNEDSSVAAHSLKAWTKKVLQSPKNMQHFMLELAENTLYDPNSPARNETLYISILEVLSKDTTLLPVIRQKYNEQLYIARQNRPGEKANNFIMMDSKGKKNSLSDFKGKYTLLMFYEPSCPACKASLEILNNSKTFVKVCNLLNLLAIYTGDNLHEWKKSTNKFNPKWIVVHDLEMEITTERLYDRRPSPSFYLLDKNQVVILKDGTTSQLLSILEVLNKEHGIKG